MKQIRFMFFSLIVVQLTLAGCGNSNGQTKYPEYLETANSELGCAELSYDGITYRPFGVFGGGETLTLTFSEFIGNQIGIRRMESPPPLPKIYEIKGYNSKEWIVEYDDILMGGNMIFKAVGVTDIPPELEKYREYDF
jgi:hypothetical protein